jgi:hypothetical protein
MSKFEAEPESSQRAVSAENLVCEGCGEPLRPTLRCTSCQYGYCQFCYRGYWEECEHLVTAIRYDIDGGWINPPFESNEIPRIPSGVRLAEYDQQQRRDAFGNFAWLLDAWQWDEDDQSEYVDQYRLYDLLISRVTVPVEPTSSHPELASEEVGQFGWFSQQPDYVRWQIALLLGKLSKGFQRLLAEPEG